MHTGKIYRRGTGLAALALMCTAASAYAATATWNGNVDTDWNNAANWSPNTVPTGSSDVAFSLTGSYVVNLTAASSAASLTQTQGSLSLGLGGQTLGVIGEFAVNGTAVANPLLTLTGGAATSTQLSVGISGKVGRLTVDGSAAKIDVTDGNSIFVGSFSAASNGTLNLTNGGNASARYLYIGSGGTGNVNVSGGATLANAPASVTTLQGGAADLNVGVGASGSGTLLVSTGGKLNTRIYNTTARIGGSGGQGTVTVQDGTSAWTHRGSVLLGDATIGAPANTLNISNGATVNITSTANNGTLQIGANGSLNLSGSTSTLNVDSMDLGNNAANVHFTGGTLNLDGAIKNIGPTPLSIGGTLGGSSNINGSLTVPAGGKIRPGDGTSTGVFNLTGNLNLAGTMQMRLLALNNYSKIIVAPSAGTPTLSGVIALSLASTYTPAVNASFDLLDFAGTLAPGYTFDFTDAPLPAGRQWNTSQFAATGAVSVEVTPEPGTAMLAVLAMSPLLARRKRRDADIQEVG